MRAEYVDPIIGTVGDEKAESMHGGGKTHPGACVPGGMVQLSPDTVTGGDNGTGYNWCQSTIEGFSFNHMSGIGWYGDLGNLQVMPIIGDTDLRSGTNEEVPFNNGTVGWRSGFSHDNEHAEAGYYSVFLDRYGVLAETTVSQRTGMLRFTYTKDGDAGIIFNFSRRIAGHSDYQSVDITDGRIIKGYIKCTPAGGGFGRGGGHIAYTLYFSLELSCPAEMRFFSNEMMQSEGLTHFEGEDVGIKAKLFPGENRQITVRCGISYTDIAGADGNLETECPDFEFDKMRADAFAAWEKALSVIDIEGTDKTDRTLFYTCLYHTLLDPRTTVDSNGRCRLANGETVEPDFNMRTMFSGWDVYRSEMPLLSLIEPKRLEETARTLFTIAESCNSSFPKWELMGIDSGCMVGDPGLLVVGDAILKGILKENIEETYSLALASAKACEEYRGKKFTSVRPTGKSYKEDCFCENSLSYTLEFLLADFVLYKISKKLNKDNEAKKFYDRALRYTENYDSETGFMGPRDEEGEFVPVEDEYSENGCIESNIFQQSWFVPYDINGLLDLFGRHRAEILLERLFRRADFSALWNSDYNHSNEPCHNITHYFNYLGKPDRTQYWTRRVQKEAYRLGAFGFCGNEDVGQISAWYVLSGMGLAQVCIGDDRFEINTPLFKRVTLTLDKKYHKRSLSDEFTILCDKDPNEFPYISEIRLNNEKLDRTYITYSEITAGGKLEFILSKEPSEFSGSISVSAIYR